MYSLISSLTDRLVSTSIDSSSLRVPCPLVVDSVFVDPPSPPLVGVEPNPGPDPRRKRGGTTTVTSVVVRKPPGGAPAQPRSSSVLSLLPGRRRRKRRNETAVVGRPGLQIAQSWARLLNDPFTNTPEPMGLGCMVPTSTFTFYKRGVIDSNADGSLSMALIPTPNLISTGKPILYNVAASGVATWSSLDFTNLGAFVAAYSTYAEVRILGGGIRLVPSIAATTAPGEIYAGALPAASWTDVNSTTNTQLISSPYVESGSGYDGATVCTRPQDTDSFVFYEPKGRAEAESSTWSVPVITCAFAGTTRVYYEVVLHCEVLPGYDATVAPGGTGQANAMTISSEFPSFESMFRYTNSFLSNATKLTSHFVNTVDTLSSAAKSIGGFGGQRGSYRLTPGSALPRIMS